MDLDTLSYWVTLDDTLAFAQPSTAYACLQYVAYTGSAPPVQVPGYWASVVTLASTPSEGLET